VDTVGGYRLVRKLGSGPRAEIYLGRAILTGDTAEQSPELGETERTAALKLFRPGVGSPAIDEEIEALARASSPHLLELRDLASTPDGRPCLILPRLVGTGLARVLADRSSIEVGEAVTILAPIAAAVAELHRVGVAHGAVRASSVLFSDAGAPVLACFGHAVLVGEFPESEDSASLTPAERSECDAVVSDLADLARMGVEVLGRVRSIETHGAGTRLVDWLSSSDPAPIADAFARDFEDRLYDLAPGAPVLFRDPAAAAPRPLPVRTSARGGQGVPLPARDARWVARIRLLLHRRSSPEARSSSGAPSSASPNPVSLTRVDRASRVPAGCKSLDEHLAERIDGHPVRETMSRARAAAARVRRPFWIAGALGAAALVAALVLVPSNADGAPNSPRSTATSRAPSPAQKSEAQKSGAQKSGAQKSGAQALASHSAGRSGSPPESKRAITGDDPAAATAALLTIREHCISTRSVACLNDVDQADASVLDDDRYLIRSLQAGGGTPDRPSLANATTTLAQMLGDSALVTVVASAHGDAAPVSVLVVKGESGWRIRDLMIG
jgi:serine/threonine protein kinase